MLSIGTQKSDRITTITNTTWAEYISLDLPSKRVSFRNGVITIVSPGRNHELIGDYLRLIILGYCRQSNIPVFTFNQTTLKEEGKEGKEPDVAYCFETDKDKPDLAVEVNLTSGNIDDLTKYQYLKIAEVWLWENNQIRFFVYRESGYLELTVSNFLPSLNSDRVTEIVNSCFGKSVLEVEKYFS
ncbi:Uma2 family endonuclease [Oscillatoria salina]|uniref:Uma2 family endonuclease n=1 Tax=Oscillatoria salina TaxID=331517 RepID=UPI0013BE3191|nr:Uma2 family endonuclease [Oscillatoria salina]MBZ8182848.1 Uma2 family endonuclease [Oscillatoria salina IIICB1]NET86955.1 Uma2 family endonuclease [Kamptonema sp. SIO1D9]